MRFFCLLRVFLTSCHSCVNGVTCCLRGWVTCISGWLFLVSRVVLGRVDCSVCHSFIEISVGVRLCLNVLGYAASFVLLQEFSLESWFQVNFFGVVWTWSHSCHRGCFQRVCLYGAHTWLVTLAFGCVRNFWCVVPLVLSFWVCSEIWLVNFVFLVAYIFNGFSQWRVVMGYALQVSPAVTRLTVYRRLQVTRRAATV